MRKGATYDQVKIPKLAPNQRSKLHEPRHIDDVEHVLRQTALLQIVALGRHALQRHPQRNGDALRRDISEHGPLGDARSKEPEPDQKVDRVGREEPVAQQSEEKSVAGGRLLGASSSLECRSV